ncbi:MAG: hypothetical protein SPE30_03435 [Candidatus Treponema excrementipullorum]|nr:hypothetical protein [Candidatus Treponema excrementipullorum]
MNFARTGWNIKQDVEDRVRIADDDFKIRGCCLKRLLGIAMGTLGNFKKSFQLKLIYVYRITDEQRQSLGMVGFVKIYRIVKLFMV